MATSADDAAKDGEQYDAADGAAETDDEGLIVVDPGAHFFRDGGAGAFAL